MLEEDTKKIVRTSPDALEAGRVDKGISRPRKSSKQKVIFIDKSINRIDHRQSILSSEIPSIICHI